MQVQPRTLLSAALIPLLILSTLLTPIHSAFAGAPMCSVSSNSLFSRLAGLKQVVIQVHDVKRDSRWTRYMVSYGLNRFLKSNTYLDVFDRRLDTVWFERRPNKKSLQKLKRRSKRFGKFNGSGKNLEAEVPKEIEDLVEAIYFGTDRALKRHIEKLMRSGQLDGLLNKQYWVRNYLFVELIQKNNQVTVRLMPTRPSMVLYPKVLNPIELHHWKMTREDAAFLGFLDFARRHPESVNSKSGPGLIHKLLIHPNAWLRAPRKLIDFFAFAFFSPQIMIWDLLTGSFKRSHYPFHRQATLSAWMMYLILETLFYTPISSHFSEEMAPEEAWSKIWDGSQMSDWYAIKAQFGLSKKGITVLWNGMDKDEIYDWVGYHISQLIHNLKSNRWNTVRVSYGKPYPDDLVNFDQVHIRDRYKHVTTEDRGVGIDRTRIVTDDLGTLYVHKRNKKIFILPSETGSGISQSMNVTYLFQAVMPVIKNIGCPANDDDCGIQNVVTISHGHSGKLKNIVNFSYFHSLLKKPREVIYRCESEGQCRGLPVPEGQQVKLDTRFLMRQFRKGVHFVLSACSIAGTKSSQESLQKFAKHFGIDQLKGRVLASKKIVHTVFFPLGVLEGPSTLRVTKTARRNNHWSTADIWKGYFKFGPTIAKQWWAGKTPFSRSREDDVFELDYR